MFRAQPFFHERVGCKWLGAPGWHDKAVVDNYVGCEGGTETLFILIGSMRRSLLGKITHFTIIAICERSSTLADREVVLEG